MGQERQDVNQLNKIKAYIWCGKAECTTRCDWAVHLSALFTYLVGSLIVKGVNGKRAVNLLPSFCFPQFCPFPFLDISKRREKIKSLVQLTVGRKGTPGGRFSTYFPNCSFYCTPPLGLSVNRVD